MLQLQFPARERTLYGLPLLDSLRRIDEVGDVLKLLAVRLVGMLAHDVALVDMLLQAQQYLAGVDGLDEVVGYLLADSLLHDALLLALGDHNDGYLGMQALDLLERLQSVQARHVLVQKDDVRPVLMA